ncbi:hypothetical protein EV378_6844 [Pseudonocardia endophytica]|uniref:Uncharacterized protein n=1 Tax=Pseudonocardia endophytica TaxID=401976 RepID=A0A4R1HNY0_PSEEN|nr:hypothetical protein EV378_6844 [Pseudonocardia endophytica]
MVLGAEAYRGRVPAAAREPCPGVPHRPDPGPEIGATR